MLRNVRLWTALAALTVLVSAVAWAADATAAGKWKWTQMRQQQSVEMVLDLKQDGEKLTGDVTAGETKTEIKEGTVKGADVAFVVIREINGNQFKSTYKGKLDGDTIKGNPVITINGEDRTTEWTATRVK